MTVKLVAHELCESDIHCHLVILFTDIRDLHSVTSSPWSKVKKEKNNQEKRLTLSSGNDGVDRCVQFLDAVFKLFFEYHHLHATITAVCSRPCQVQRPRSNQEVNIPRFTIASRGKNYSSCALFVM